MICDKCGNELRSGANFCNKCGARISERGSSTDNSGGASTENQMPLSAQQPQAYDRAPKQQVIYQPVYQPVYQPQPRPYYAPGTHPYHNLGGFLMFIVVVSYISGVSSFISVISTIISCSGILSMGNWLPDGIRGWVVFFMIGSIILSIVTGGVVISYANKIRRKESDFLGFIQSASITMMIIFLVFYLLVFIGLKQFDRYGVMSSGSMAGFLISMVIVWLIGLIVGSVYFGCSVRVRTYMGSDAYLRQSVFNKNSHPIPADGSDQPGVVDYNKAVIFDPEKQWYCTQCGRINEKYTTTCICGMAKPSGDLSRSWICKNCGRYNMGNLYECANCGRKKYQEPVYTDWICPKCGGRNSYTANSCSVCYTENPNKKSSVGKTPWVCPKCGRVNASYVGTCACGQVKP